MYSHLIISLTYFIYSRFLETYDPELVDFVRFDLNTDPQILENPFLSLVPQDIPSSISSLILGKDKNTCTCHLSYLVLYLGLNGVEIHHNISEDHAYRTCQNIRLLLRRLSSAFSLTRICSFHEPIDKLASTLSGNMFFIHAEAMQASDDNNIQVSYDMQEKSDDLVITSSKGSTLPLPYHIKGEEDDGENTVDLRLSTVSFSAS